MHNHVASLTYVCFIPAKGLIRDLSANSSNIAFEVPLASKWWWQSGLIHPASRAFSYGTYALYREKALHESCQVLVEHAQRVAK